jgi:hypothetical protein
MTQWEFLVHFSEEFGYYPAPYSKIRIEKKYNIELGKSLKLS